MYKINQPLMMVVKTGFLFGMPLLCSYLLPSLSNYRLICIGLLTITLYLNHFYPDRIGLEEEKIHIKLFLCNEWITYPRQDLRFIQGKSCIYIETTGKRRYRLSMNRLSRNLYEELREGLQQPANKKSVEN